MRILLVCGLLAAVQPSPAGDLEGVWMAVLEAGAARLRLIARVTRTESGYRGALDSVEQGVQGLPLRSIEFDGVATRFELDDPHAVFEGRMSADGAAIEGEWRQGGGTAELTFRRQTGEPDLARPQEPKRPYPYREEEVVFRGAGVGLAGTLTAPPGGGPFPAVLLLSGSGPQDRDESIMGHKPFLVLADYLTRRGFVVLRADDRGVGGSAGSIEPATLEEFAADALGAVSFLRSRDDVLAHKVGLVGHSEGALTAALAAARSNDVAFVALLASPGVPGEEVLLSQSEIIASRMGVDPQDVAEHQAVQRRIFEIVRSEPDDARANRLAQAELAARIDEMSRDRPAEFRDALERAVAGIVVSPWLRSLLSHDPAPILRAIRQPMLVLAGENDLQVAPELNLPPIRRALRESRNPRARVVLLPGLNHLFQGSRSGLPLEYGAIEETFSPLALRVLGDWLAER